MMKIILFIIFIILFIVNTIKYSNIEFFVDTGIYENQQIIKKKSKKYIDIVKENKNYFTKYLSSKKNDKRDLLLELIILSFIIRNTETLKMNKDEFKHYLYQNFGPHIINTSHQNLKKINTTIGYSIQIPINIMSKISWLDYDILFKTIDIKNGIKLKDVLEIKTILLTQQYVNNEVHKLRSPYFYDENTNHYHKNYIKLLTHKKKINYETQENNLYYKTFNHNLTVDTMINILNSLKHHNIIFGDSYNNVIKQTYSNNIYVRRKKDLKKIVVNLKKNIKQNETFPVNTKEITNNHYSSDIQHYPLRFQLPLNHNCQRIWENCNDLDRINQKYNYYGTSKNNEIFFYNTNNIGDNYFSSGVKL